MKLRGGSALPRAGRLVFKDLQRSICFCGGAGATAARLVFRKEDDEDDEDGVLSP